MIKVVASEGDANLPSIPTEGHFTSNQVYTCSYTGNYWITCIGGGGAGGSGSSTFAQHDSGYTTRWTVWGAGGGSGYANQKLVHINRKETVDIIIGSGGIASANANGSAGGTTSFGSYLSATGGGGGQSPIPIIGNNNLSAGISKYSKIAGGSGFKSGQNGSWRVKDTDPDGGTESDIRSNLGNGGEISTTTNSIPPINLNGSIRLYYGDGGDGSLIYSSTMGGNGNSGIVIVEFVN